MTAAERHLIASFQQEYYSLTGRQVAVELRPQPPFRCSLTDLYRRLDQYCLQKTGQSLASPLRRPPVTYLRMIFCQIAHQLGYSLSQIGRQLGGRHHTTVRYMLKTACNLEESKNPVLRKLTGDVTHYLSKYHESVV